MLLWNSSLANLAVPILNWRRYLLVASNITVCILLMLYHNKKKTDVGLPLNFVCHNVSKYQQFKCTEIDY